MSGEPLVLPRALVAAFKESVTGSLVAISGAVTRLIWIREGNPVYCDSTAYPESFAAILGRKGVLTETEILLVDAEHARPGVREEQALLASGLLGPGEVVEYAKAVFDERLLTDFGLADPLWSVEPAPLPPGMPTFEVPLAAALLRGIRERYTPDRLAIEFPLAGEDRYVYRPAALARHPKLFLPKGEVRLTTLLDGKTRWKEVLAAAKLDPPKAHAALYALSLLGVAEYQPPSVLPLLSPRGVEPIGAAEEPLKEHAARGKAGEMRERGALDPLSLLELEGRPDPVVAQQAFRWLVECYDLGRAHFLPEEDREAALALLDRAIEALLLVTHPEARERFLDADPQGRATVAAALAGPFTAEKAYLKAGLFIQAGAYLAAEAALLPALQLEPREARYHLRMGICIYLRARTRDQSALPVGALRSLEKAVALDGKLDEGWLYLGHFAVAQGDLKKAVAHYQRALSLNPERGEARRALARIGKG